MRELGRALSGVGMCVCAPNLDSGAREKGIRAHWLVLYVCRGARYVELGLLRARRGITRLTLPARCIMICFHSNLTCVGRARTSEAPESTTAGSGGACYRPMKAPFARVFSDVVACRRHRCAHAVPVCTFWRRANNSGGGGGDDEHSPSLSDPVCSSEKIRRNYDTQYRPLGLKKKQYYDKYAALVRI